MSLLAPPVAFTLSAATRAALRQAWTPDGGGPGALVRMVDASANPRTGAIALEDGELLKLRRYAYDYTTGTYQKAFRGVLSDARAAGWQEPPEQLRDAHERQPKHKGRRWSGDK